MIKKVGMNTSGSGHIVGKVYLPKKFIGKLVLIKELSKEDVIEFERKEKEIIQFKEEMEKRLYETHRKLKKIRNIRRRNEN